MADAFPVSPAVNEIATVGMFQYKWNGTEWLFPVNEVPEGSVTSTPVATKRVFLTTCYKSGPVEQYSMNISSYSPELPCYIKKIEIWFDNVPKAITTSTIIELTAVTSEEAIFTEAIELPIPVPANIGDSLNTYHVINYNQGDLESLSPGNFLFVDVTEVSEVYSGEGIHIRITMEEL